MSLADAPVTAAAMPTTPQYGRVQALFLRLLGAVYLIAFSSAALQVLGLYGSDGIIPISNYLPALELEGLQRWLALPTLFWLSQGDAFLLAVPLAGAAVSVLLLAGLWPGFSLVAAWIAYLSLVNAGPVFMQYQWDILLLEAGFLAIMLHRLPLLGVWLYRWLLFRLMFLSGWAKVAGGDSAWADWSALATHFETQPLPSLLGWHAHHLPDPLLHAATAATLTIELALPFFIFLSRWPRQLAFWGFTLLQALIFVTGNFSFFNILAFAISLFLLDDRYLAELLPRRLLPNTVITTASGRPRVVAGTLVTVLLLLVSVNQVFLAVSGRESSGWQRELLVAAQPFHIASNYGVFAVMTRERPEIVVEVSNDGRDWQPYPFRFKPGDTGRPPAWIAPLHPRLDWQMWFAAHEALPPQWFDNLLMRLLLGSPDVERLLGPPPPIDLPPRYVRAVRYHYQFTTEQQLAISGDWWHRSYLNEYHPPLQLIMDTGELPGARRELPD